MPNAARQPRAAPSAVESGTPRTKPPDTPIEASAIARPVWVAGTSRAAYPMQTEKKRAWVMPPATRPTASTPKVGAMAEMTLLTTYPPMVASRTGLRGSRLVAERKRNRQHGHHDRVRTDQQTRGAGTHVECGADLGQKPDRDQLGRHRGEDRHGQNEQACTR